MLCSGWEENKLLSASYIIRMGRKDNFIDRRLVHGEDKWHWKVDDQGLVVVSGPATSSYGGFHNRDNLTETPPTSARTFFTQTLNGEEPTVLMKDVKGSGLLYVICSSSSGVEACVAGAVYAIQFTSKELSSSFIKGKALNSYEVKDTEKLWTFDIANSNLVVHGPKGPCRYSYVSNLPETEFNVSERCQQSWCLGTGAKVPLTGAVKTDDKGITGWTSDRTDINIYIDGRPRFHVAATSLRDVKGQFAFHIDWTQEEKTTGLYQVRVFALQKHLQSKYSG